MPRTIRIKKGLNIKLVGEAQKTTCSLPLPETVALKPPDFTGLVPKLLVQPGDEVRAGTPLFSDKTNEGPLCCATVSGEVVEVLRGEKRRVMAVRILADRETDYLDFGKADPLSLSKQEITEKLILGGVWPFIRQRPYGIVARPSTSPRDIFISMMDTNPMGPDIGFTLLGNGDDFRTGLEALTRLTTGKVHLCAPAGQRDNLVAGMPDGVEVHTVSGPHPAGNVGVQIHHIAPINKGDIVWYIHPQDVLIIGRLFRQGILDARRTIVLTGSGVRHPKYYQTITGAPVQHLLADGGLQEGSQRLISGNVLTGRKLAPDGYIGFFDNQVTVIPEGDEPEFMGWLKPGLAKFSVSRTFFSWLTPGKQYNLDTNLHGEERPFVITGQYENVFPMDIYPVQLLKSVLVEDIELMEKLGIYEVLEEDFALCEFVCTSKIESQEIIRRGLDLVRREIG